ncbi:MAG: choice-of-anchor D domain-containing protein, partial [Terracidiphilus sp.]
GTLTFGPVEVGKESAALQVTVENGGASAIPIASVNLAAPFVLTNNGCGSSLAANSDCALSVTFAPTQMGLATGTLTIVGAGGTQTVQLSGTGASPPTDALSPSSLNFSGTIIGASSLAQTVTLTDSGGVPLTSIATSASGPFQASSNCGTQLAAGSSCAVSVVFVPAAAGTQTGMLTVSDLQKTQTVPLSGTGLLPPVIAVNPTSLIFPSQQMGAASVPLTLTVSNGGGAPMSNVGFQITGPSATSFSTGASTCGAVLNSGSSCTAQVIFTPAATGGNAATLTVSSSTLGVKAATVALSGTGTAASGLNVSPGQMTFAEALLGQASAAQTVTISNSSAASVTGITLFVAGPFGVVQNTCGAGLGAGASCSVAIVFTPTVNGAAQGTLAVEASSFNTATVILNGSGGLAGAVQLQPASLSFSSTGVGTTSGAQTITVTNASAVMLSDFALTISNGFQLASDTCTTSLAPGANCTVGIAFAPASSGQQTGNLTVASSTMASGVQAPLSGTGTDFSASLSGASGQTVASGQTASFALVLTPASGSAGTFTFHCGALPANAACVFNPASETVAANSTGSVTVQVVTGISASAAHISGVAAWGAVSLACGVLLLPLAWARRRRDFLLVLLGILVMGGLSSCSGSGGGTGGTPPAGASTTNTPAGTYSIPVTVVSNGVSHAVTLSLTVD